MEENGTENSDARDIRGRDVVVTAFSERDFYPQLYEAILKSAGDGIFGLDAEDKTVFVNPAAESMLRYRADELINQPQHALIHHSRADGTHYPIEQCPNHASLKDGVVHRVSGEVFWRKDQTSFPVEYVSTPICRKGAIVGTVIIFRDISTQLEKERLQKDLITALRESDRIKDQFLSVLSHELRTPLEVIVGYGTLLEDELGEGPSKEEQAHLQGLLGASDALLTMIDNLLEMSKIRGRKLILAPRPINLAEVAHGVLETFSPKLHGKHLHLKTVLPTDLPAIVADDERIATVIANLLDNAIKFTSEGGTIELKAKLEGNHVRCEVTDTGPGIAPQDLSTIFNWFTQVDMSSTRQVGGLGIGLFISKALVEAHGGQIGVESDPGKGSTFWFTLPCS
ncbi:MAG TPA: PAS domain-containing sensor histidine kinase [Stenomitos sp.]